MTAEPPVTPIGLEEEFERVLESDDPEGGLEDLCRRFPGHAAMLRGWLQRAEKDTTEAAERVVQDLPDRIGPYRILGQLGEGGMGTVYVAEQSTPMQRRVAIKVIRLGLATRDVLARFDAERQALAMMNHPHIAKVFDAGATDVGQPYFVMELVRGLPITNYCERRRVPLEDRLGLLLQVCLGLQHAHHKGVIHRDIKPSNILVEEQDGTPVAKIIDFGLARATDRRLTEKTIYTELGQIIGSPEYMSPEQAEMTGADIDTRTDVYSIGVLLYELITGTLPFDARELRRGTYQQMQRRILEDEPQRPSARVTRIASQPRGSFDQIDLAPLSSRQLRGDLDRITLKALHKDRVHRYQTPTELAADVERFLHHEPVSAAPPSSWYRFRKWARRHRTQFAAALAVLASLVIGLLVSVWQYVGAEGARQEAESYLSAFNRLADKVRLQRLVDEAETLWPRRPERRAAIDAWLAAATALVQRGREHEGVLGQLSLEPGSSAAARIDREFLIGALQELVDALGEFADPDEGLVGAVRRRQAWASSIHAASIDRHRAAWDAAVAAVARDARYAGLALAPQLGLVPIGADPASGLQEFAHLASGEVPQRDASTGALEPDEESCVVFVLLPAGVFAMGAQFDNSLGRNYDEEAQVVETPVRRVSLEAFFLAKYEMTQGQWLRLSEGEQRGTYRPVPGRPITLLYPVETVSWHECRELLRRHALQLPTEAQWEYACRGGTKDQPWWSGATRESLLDPPLINIADRAAYDWGARWGGISEWPDYDDGYRVHAPVDAFPANPFGLHSLPGNVAEWCRDAFGPYSGVRPRPGDGLREPPTGSTHAVRGGSFRRGVSMSRASGRAGVAGPHEDLGVRPARSIEP